MRRAAGALTGLAPYPAGSARIERSCPGSAALALLELSAGNRPHQPAVDDEVLAGDVGGIVGGEEGHGGGDFRGMADGAQRYLGGVAGIGVRGRSWRRGTPTVASEVILPSDDNSG